MKKILIFLLSFSLLISLASCKVELGEESEVSTVEEGCDGGEESGSNAGGSEDLETDLDADSNKATEDVSDETLVDEDGNITTENQTDSDEKTDGESEEKTEEETESPYLAPDFTVYDRDGNKVDLSDFRGKPIVVNIWASGCNPCRSEMPDFEEAYQKYGDEVEFLMVNYIGFFGETVESASAYVETQGYTFPIYFDSDHDMAYTYGINSIPFTMFINSDFELYTYLVGSTSFETIEYYIGCIK